MRVHAAASQPRDSLPLILIKGTIQQQIIDLIRKENQESEASEQYDNLQREAEHPSQLPRKKKRLVEIFKKPTTSHKLRAEDLATREVDQYIHSPCPNVDTNPLEWWKTHYIDYTHLVCLTKKYLCIPATSVASEHLFSTSRNKVSDK